MPEQDWCTECEGIHILRTSCEYFTAACKLGALSFSFGGCLIGFESMVSIVWKEILTTTNGIPISANSRLHSSLCSLVTLTVRLAKRSTSSVVPAQWRLVATHTQRYDQPTSFFCLLSFLLSFFSAFKPFRELDKL